MQPLLWLRPAILSLLLGPSSLQEVEQINLASVALLPQWQSPWVVQQLMADPQAEAILSQYVSRLDQTGFDPDLQSILVEANRYPIAHFQADRRLPAASLTKVATTLAAIETWGVEHQFETYIGMRGILADGTLQGDLIVQGGNDPLFVWEEAIALGNALQQLGVKRVTGNLIVTPGFVMNYKTDPAVAGGLLKQAFNANSWGGEANKQYQALPPGTPKPQIQIDGQVQVGAPDLTHTASAWLVRHQSLPMVAILKAMNIYSNNVMSEMVANTLGGPTAVMQIATTVAGVPPQEISLVNGSGLGEDNQLSARAVVSMMQTIQVKLQQYRFNVADVFPVYGTDKGTISDRTMPANATVKTGSLAVVSSLAGAFPTEDKGVVWFAVVNYGSGLNTFRDRQDQLLQSLEQRWGKAAEVPSELKATVKFNQGEYRLGDPKRNQAVAN
ncbi:MAG: D-alanyl-D-alanine carboxypeptidase [Cyanobacteria bacterium J06648_16]